MLRRTVQTWLSSPAMSNPAISNQPSESCTRIDSIINLSVHSWLIARSTASVPATVGAVATGESTTGLIMISGISLDMASMVSTVPSNAPRVGSGGPKRYQHALPPLPKGGWPPHALPPPVGLLLPPAGLSWRVYADAGRPAAAGSPFAGGRARRRSSATQLVTSHAAACRVCVGTGASPPASSGGPLGEKKCCRTQAPHRPQYTR
jgi:hypothetical protein